MKPFRKTLPWLLLIALCSIGATCAPGPPPPNKGGLATVVGTDVSLVGPENPNSPTQVKTKKTTVTTTQPKVVVASLTPTPARAFTESTAPATVSTETAPATVSIETVTVTEETSITLGSSWKQDLIDAGKLAKDKWLMFLGLGLLVSGPFIAFKLGWHLNGLIVSATGIAALISNNTLWLLLLGTCLVVAYVYYKSQHDK